MRHFLRGKCFEVVKGEYFLILKQSAGSNPAGVEIVFLSRVYISNVSPMRRFCAQTAPGIRKIGGVERPDGSSHQYRAAFDIPHVLLDCNTGRET